MLSFFFAIINESHVHTFSDPSPHHFTHQLPWRRPGNERKSCPNLLICIGVHAFLLMNGIIFFLVSSSFFFPGHVFFFTNIYIPLFDRRVSLSVSRVVPMMQLSERISSRLWTLCTGVLTCCVTLHQMLAVVCFCTAGLKIRVAAHGVVF